MISIEQWRARIGLFNCKQCSGFLSSFVSPPSSSRSRHRQRRPWNVVQWLGTLFSVTVDSFSFLPATKDHPPVNTTSLPECSSSSTSSSSVSIGTSETQVFSLRRSLLRDLLIVLLIAIVSQQLIISGDIETNPGPTLDDKPGLDDLLYMSYTGENGGDVSFRLMDRLKPPQHWRNLAIALKFPSHKIATIESKDDPVFCLLSEWLQGANHENDQRPVTWRTLIGALRHANVHAEANELEKHYIQVPSELVNPIQLDTTPTLLKLKTMRGPDDKPLKIIQTIGAGDYMTFGMCLLQDENGMEVELIEKNNINKGAEGVTQAILKKWLTSGASTHTYKHLIECLRQSEMDALADNIAGLPPTSPDSKQTTTKQHSDTLSSYSSYLKGIYRRRSQSHTSQHWSHLPRCEFIQLAMIAGEKIRRGEPEEEMIRLTQQGNIEAAMRQKKQVDLADLFLSHEHQTSELDMDTLIITPLQHRVILIEGVPGGGKSTLALHICHQWAQGASFLAEFDIVILAYLRDQAVQKAEDLLQILSVLHSNVLNFSRIINSIQASRVLFIFDGWDEFPPHLQQKSLVSTIIRQPDELDLPQSTVVITTRPVASGNLYHIADQRVEILGFTPHQIREYIEKALDSDSIPVQKLLQHLEEHPVIEEYCYVPLHAAILVHVFLTMKGVLPTTLHELFYKLVLCCIVREVETHHIKTDEIITNFSSLLDLPDFLKSQLNDLSILAYKGVRQGKIVFSQSDLDAFQLSTKLPSLGLLVAVEGLTESGKSLSYNFLHLSIQQLLAAYHISQMDADEQVKVFQQMLQSSLLLPVLIHYSGFTKLDHPEVQGFISAYSQQLTHFQDILPLLHCFFAAQQPFVSQLVDQRFRCLELKTVLNPIDYLVVGFFINSLLSMSVSNNSSVTIKIRQIDDYRLNLLLFELSKYPIEGVPQVRVGHLPGRLILCLYDLNITGKMMTALFSRLGQLQAISEFSTCNIHHCEGELLDLTKALQSNPNLTSLVFRNTRLYTGDNGHAFIKLSQLNKSLTHLDLSMNEKFLDFDARRIIFQFLEHNTSLLHLNLSNTGITSMEIDTVNALEQMLKNNKSLNHLDLSKNALLDSVAHKMFQALQCNTTLRCLNIGNTCITATEEDTIMALQLMLENNKSLTHLDLSENLFSDTAVCCIFECVKQNTTLVHLDMNSTGITATPTTVQKLTQMLKQNKLKHLGLSNNILHSEAHCIFQTLQHNTALVYIDLCNTGITATHACALQTMLEKNKTLAYLNLSQNGLSDLGILFVSNGLRKNTTLVYLNLCQTGIKNEGAKYIARALAFNNSLQTLDISNNYIGDGIVEDDGFRHIERSLESNSMLRKLIISNRYYKYHISWYRASSINRSGIRQRKGLHPIDSVV